MRQPRCYVLSGFLSRGPAQSGKMPAGSNLRNISQWLGNLPVRGKGGALGKWVLALLILSIGGCCVEEPSTFVFTTPTVDEAISRACRASSQDTEAATIDRAVETYYGFLTYDPARTCVEYPGTACQLNYPCGHPPDMSGASNDCPPPPPPRRRYYACLGCGRQPSRRWEESILLLPETSALLDLVVQKSGATSREEALYKAILHFEKIWLEERKKPDFGSRPYQRTKSRKPDEPCFGQPTPKMLLEAAQQIRREAEQSRLDMAQDGR